MAKPIKGDIKPDCILPENGEGPVIITWPEI